MRPFRAGACIQLLGWRVFFRSDDDGAHRNPFTARGVAPAPHWQPDVARCVAQLRKCNLIDRLMSTMLMAGHRQQQKARMGPRDRP